MPEPDNRLVEFNRLNTVGKAVFIAGSAFKTLGALVDVTVDTIGTIWTDAEQAFRKALDDGIEDARIIDEDSH